MILTVGAAALVATCVGAVAPGGRVVLFAGFGAAPHATLDLDVIHYREVSLVGSEWIGTPPNQRRERYADALGADRAAASVPVERLVSGEVGLDGIEDAFAAVREQRGLKYVLRPWQRDVSDRGAVALVTGGGRGIGRATAIALARAGARVTVTARTRDEVAAVAAEIGGDSIAASAATAEGCAAIVEETRRRSGPIDILVCSAGHRRRGARSRSGSSTDERWRDTLATNLDGPFYLSRLVTRGDDAARLRAHRLRRARRRARSAGRRSRPTAPPSTA